MDTNSKKPQKIALLSCTKSKLKHDAKACELYSPSTLFSRAYEYSKGFADKIFILSAKYGLLKEDDVISPYDMTLKDYTKQEKLDWSAKIVEQLKEVCDLENDEFVILAGNNYIQHILPSIKNYTLPLDSLSFGNRIQYLNKILGKETAKKETKSKVAKNNQQ